MVLVFGKRETICILIFFNLNQQTSTHYLFLKINWLAVLAGALAYFALGAMWYSKILFAPRWLALTRIDASDPAATKGMRMLMLFSFLVIMLNVVGLGILQNKLQLANTVMSGVKLGTLTGLCFGCIAISNLTCMKSSLLVCIGLMVATHLRVILLLPLSFAFGHSNYGLLKKKRCINLLYTAFLLC